VRLSLERDLARMIKPIVFNWRKPADKRRNRRYWRELGITLRGREPLELVNGEDTAYRNRLERLARLAGMPHGNRG
jgi:hypothetical protein